MNKREITQKEKNIIKDIMTRSNYSEERAKELAKEMVEFGYTIHEQYYLKLKKAITILKDKFKFELGVSVVKEKYCYSLEFLFNNQYFSITKEEYELLKEMLEEE